MQNALIFLVTLSLSSNAISQSIFSTLHLNEERDITSGIPRTITEYRVFYNSNSTERKKDLTEYDQSGLPVSKNFFDENGKVTSVVTYKFDTIKRVILESSVNEINVRFPTEKVRTTYHYDNSRSPTRIQYLNGKGQILSEAILKNDSLGLPIELRLFEPLENLIGFEIASYIPNENKAIVSVGNNQGRLLTTDTMKISFKDAHKFNDPNVKYNEKGDVVFSQSRWRDGTMHYREYDYIYDEMGNWTEQKAFEIVYKSKDKKKRTLRSHFKREIQYWKK